MACLDTGRHSLSMPVRFAGALRESCLADPSGDTLDAVLCAVAAAWGWCRRERGYGLPAGVDPLEGWIVGAAPAAVIGAAGEASGHGLSS